MRHKLEDRGDGGDGLVRRAAASLGILTRHPGGAVALLAMLLAILAPPLVTYELQLRDAEPFLINSYLTNGGKSIPKLIARNEDGTDLFTWGPRPAAAQALMDRLKKEGADFETIKTGLQNWYNADKGRSLQGELLQAVSAIRIRQQVA